MAALSRVVEPPFYDPPIADNQQHSQAWTEYHQSVADRLTALHAGSTDGGDAASGDVGEFMETSSSAALATGGHTDVASLNLTAGDWDVSGSAVITPTIPNMTFAQAWLGTAAGTPIDPGRSAIQSGSTGSLGAVALVVGPIRLVGSGTMVVHLGCQANFPGGTSVSASAHIQARRAR